VGKRLEGQRALVTGASSGIGAALARLLAREGADLVITARRRDRLQELARQLVEDEGVQVQVEDLDLAQPDAALELVARTEGSGKAVDVLVNNAGFGVHDEFVNVPWERYADMLQLNVVALTCLTRHIVPEMVARRRGHVMNVASIGAYLPTPDLAVYAATKAYVRNFTEALGYELRDTGVKAISVCPGATKTEFSQAANQEITRSGQLVMMTAERCARIALRKMLRGRRNVVTGSLNALGMWLLRLVPRALQPWFADVFLGAGTRKAAPKALPAPTDGERDGQRS
jgi:short-subunit dehydrogenase